MFWKRQCWGFNCKIIRWLFPGILTNEDFESLDDVIKSCVLIINRFLRLESSKNWSAVQEGVLEVFSSFIQEETFLEVRTGEIHWVPSGLVPSADSELIEESPITLHSFIITYFSRYHNILSVPTCTVQTQHLSELFHHSGYNRAVLPDSQDPACRGQSDTVHQCAWYDFSVNSSYWSGRLSSWW